MDFKHYFIPNLSNNRICSIPTIAVSTNTKHICVPRIQLEFHAPNYCPDAILAMPRFSFRPYQAWFLAS